ncbi:MAG TPA: DUF58 domain-containing protein [Candidatus Nanoarchaeia archaeon]|nr:DUF58 domain-containing protein [Candidatus Nanoarchaeia archaeon]
MAIGTEFLAELSKFNLVISKRVTSKYTGPRKSNAIGRGLIFREHRIYAPGDDIRDIDWRVFARTDDLYIKKYEEERNLTLHIVVDFSASMGYGKNISKFDYAAMIGTGFAYLAMKENERFQFATFSEELSVFQPRRGMGQLAAMIDHLNAIKTHGKSRLKDAIHQYKKLIGSRAMVIIISDFLMPIDEINEVLFMLGSNEVKIIQVLDPVEKELKMTGDFKLKDSETGDKLVTHISPRLQMQYQKLMSEHAGKINDTCARLKMKFYTVTTDTPIFDAFYQILS